MLASPFGFMPSVSSNGAKAKAERARETECASEADFFSETLGLDDDFSRFAARSDLHRPLAEGIVKEIVDGFAKCFQAKEAAWPITADDLSGLISLPQLDTGSLAERTDEVVEVVQDLMIDSDERGSNLGPLGNWLWASPRLRSGKAP